MQEVLDELKYTLLQKLLTTGRDGKNNRGRNPEIVYIKAIIQAIDSGEILGAANVAVREPDMTPEEENRHLSRLNLKQNDEK